MSNTALPQPRLISLSDIDDQAERAAKTRDIYR